MIYVTGDVHADAFDLEERLTKTFPDRERDRTSQSATVILLGDVGVRYGKTTHRDMLDVMGNEYPEVRFVVMRGNHDNRYWRDAKASYSTKSPYVWRPSGDFAWLNRHGNKVLIDTAYPNVEYVDDAGGLYEYDDQRILFIPGAYSIDIGIRRAYGYPYEPEELLTRDEMERLTDITRGNDKPLYVCSHTAPMAWEPQISGLFADGVDQSKVDKSMERWLDIILDVLGGKCLGWYFGHFHCDMDVYGTCGHMLFHEVRQLGEDVWKRHQAE